MLDRRTVILGLASAATAPVCGHASERKKLFETLWKNHPMKDGWRIGVRWPCRKLLDVNCLVDPDDLTRDQCSIRLGVAIRLTFGNLSYFDFPALLDSNSTGSARRALTCTALTTSECKHSDDDLHFIRSIELASSLLYVASKDHRDKHPKFSWLGQPEEYRRPPGKRNDFRSRIGSRNGIVFVENYTLGNQRELRGTHIDLWIGRYSRTKNEFFYGEPRNPIDRRFDDVADRILFWPI